MSTWNLSLIDSRSCSKNPLPSSFFISRSSNLKQKILKDSKKYIKPTILPSFFLFKTQIKDLENAQRLKRRGFAVRSSRLEVAHLGSVRIVRLLAWVKSKSPPVFNLNRGVALLLLLQVLHSHFCFSGLLFINVFVSVACSGLLLSLLLALGCWVALSRCFVL